MSGIKHINSRTVVIANSNIDTDQLMPARFLTTTTREGLGQHLFADWRYDKNGQPIKEFVLNDPAFKDAQILVAGVNIGCGSSREHAPWGLLDYGFKAVISSQIADIFKNNCLKNGLLPITVPVALHEWLLAHPGIPLSIDIEAQQLTTPDSKAHGFDMEPFAKYCFLNGVDETGYVLSQLPAIEAYEKRMQS
jgi:3-isopropylmalate/(R)-2-methylmalate dehydratase small subunit